MPHGLLIGLGRGVLLEMALLYEPVYDKQQLDTVRV